MESIESVANTLISGVDWLTHLAHIASVVAGLVLLAMAVALFKAHRDNPKYVPLDKPVIYVLLGAVLLAVPFLNHFFGPTGSSIDLKQQAMATVTQPLAWADEPVMSTDLVDIDAPIAQADF